MGRRTFYNDELRVAYAARFAAELAAILYDVGLTHRELAQELGVAQATVDSWTRVADPKVPGAPNLLRLCAVLEGRQPSAGTRLSAAAGQPLPSGGVVPRGPAEPATGRAVSAAGAAEVPRPDTNAPARPSNVLPALTPFVGRAAEIQEIQHRLAHARLVTLVGAGGIGKTRLAQELVRGLAGYPEGVWLVELDAVRDPALLPATIAQVLRPAPPSDRLSGAALATQLGDQRLLLVLDNCEHLVAACAALAETLLQRCSHLHILATSREALGCAGETVWPVHTLSIPSGAGRVPAGQDAAAAAAVCAAVAHSEAGQLFLARAGERQPGFALTPQNAPAVAEICHRLDGMPLALELAAARVAALTVEEIAQRLDACLQLLTQGRRTRVPRQQALQASLEWSFDLLSAPERLLFRRLGVFMGGWTLAAAEGICAGDGLSPDGVLNHLLQLVEKSLVVAEPVAQGTPGGGPPGSETRYRLLEPIRQYALERLAASPEAETVRLRHAQFFAALVARAAPDFYAHTDALGYAQVVAEQDNIRAALAWTTAPRRGGAPSGPPDNAQARPDVGDDRAAAEERTELGLGLIGILDTFWGARGGLEEAAGWVAKALAQSDPRRRTAARARALTMAVRLKIQSGQFIGLQDSLAESEAIWREIGDKSGLSRTLTLIGAGLLHTGRLEAGRAVFRESQALAEEAGDPAGLAFMLFAWGNTELELGDLATAHACLQRSVAVCTAHGVNAFRTVPLLSLARVAWLQGDYAGAQQMAEDALAAHIAHGNEWPIAGALNSLADIVRCRGDYVRAAALAQQSLDIFRKLGDRSSTAWVLYTLGHTARQAGDDGQAHRYWIASLEMDRELGKDRDAVTCVAALAGAYYAAGQRRRAATLFGAADTLLRRAGIRWSPADEATYRQSSVAAQEALGAEQFQRDWERGQAMAETEVVALALDEVPLLDLTDGSWRACI